MWLKLDDPWSGNDKYQHWLGGTLLGAVTSLVLYLQPMDVLHWRIFLYSFIVVTFVAWMKEIWDKFHPPHTASLQDALTTMGGGIVGALAGLQIATFILIK